MPSLKYHIRRSDLASVALADGIAEGKGRAVHTYVKAACYFTALPADAAEVKVSGQFSLDRNMHKVVSIGRRRTLIETYVLKAVSRA